jgi:hypothetical protein
MTSPLRLRRGLLFEGCGFDEHEGPASPGRIRKLRLLAVLTVLVLLSGVAFSLGLVRAVASEIPSLDPARQQASNQVDSVIYASDHRNSREQARARRPAR